MLSLTDNVLILVAAMTGSLLFMVFVNRMWPPRLRYGAEDLIGWQLNVLATTHAVILGFMFYTAWTNFTASQLNTDLEAGSLENVFRLAGGLPAQQRMRLEMLARSYADAVLHEDWPELARGRLPEGGSHRINELMWQTLATVKTTTASESTAQDHALSELSTLTQFRRTRFLQSASRLPGIFWCVLLVGGVLTTLSVSMFGSSHYPVHFFQVFSLTLLITLALLAIADLDRPFQGWVHVDNYAFQRATQNMRQMESP
jgi:Protein of unknown function (DUF4239)